jgi:hypothetical protein
LGDLGGTLQANASDADVPKVFSTSYGEDEDSWSMDASLRMNIEFQKVKDAMLSPEFFALCASLAPRGALAPTWLSRLVNPGPLAVFVCDAQITRLPRCLFGSKSDTSRHVTSRHVTSRHVTLCDVWARHTTSRHITAHHVTSRHVTCYAGRSSGNLAPLCGR